MPCNSSSAAPGRPAPGPGGLQPPPDDSGQCPMPSPVGQHAGFASAPHPALIAPLDLRGILRLCCSRPALEDPSSPSFRYPCDTSPRALLEGLAPQHAPE